VWHATDLGSAGSADVWHATDLGSAARPPRPPASSASRLAPSRKAGAPAPSASASAARSPLDLDLK
jgi:hypothetical protein